jgi:hypothetical protein
MSTSSVKREDYPPNAISKYNDHGTISAILIGRGSSVNPGNVKLSPVNFIDSFRSHFLHPLEEKTPCNSR